MIGSPKIINTPEAMGKAIGPGIQELMAAVTAPIGITGRVQPHQRPAVSAAGADQA